MKLTKRQRKKLEARRLKKALLKREHLQGKLTQLMEKMMNDMKNSVQEKNKDGYDVTEAV